MQSGGLRSLSTMLLLLLPLLSLLLPMVFAQLDKGACGQGKTCAFFKSCNGQFSADCPAGLSFEKVNDTLLMELVGRSPSTGNYIAMAFSPGGHMENAFVTECSSLGTAPLSVKLSYNDDNPTNVRIPNEETFHKEVITDEIMRAHDGLIYCSWTQKLSPTGVPDQVFQWKDGANYTLLLATGPTTTTGIAQHTLAYPVITTDFKNSAAATDDGKRNLVKAHGCLMMIAWMVCVPAAGLFARFLRSHWPTTKPFGLAVWFHVHRMTNISALLLMVAGLVCILVYTDWKWTGVWGKGNGKDESYWVAVHSTIGIVSLVLGWMQPFIAITRCNPQHPRRPVFNWVHRCVGVLAFILAITTITIASAEFVTFWPNNYTLKIVFALCPLAIIEAVLIVMWLIERNVRVQDSNVVKVQAVKFSLVLMSIVLLAGCAITLIVLLAISQ